MAAARPAVMPTREETPPPAPAPAKPEHEGTVDALLDLMFPSGIKTRHFAALEEWRQHTLRVLREVSDDD